MCKLIKMCSLQSGQCARLWCLMSRFRCLSLRIQWTNWIQRDKRKPKYFNPLTTMVVGKHFPQRALRHFIVNFGTHYKLSSNWHDEFAFPFFSRLPFATDSFRMLAEPQLRWNRLSVSTQMSLLMRWLDFRSKFKLFESLSSYLWSIRSYSRAKLSSRRGESCFMDLLVIH